MFELHTDWPLVKAGLFTTLSPSHTNVSAPPSPVLIKITWNIHIPLYFEV